MSGTIALTRLEVRRAFRNRRVMFFSVLYPVALYLVIGGSVKGNVDGISYKTYYMISMATFGALGSSLTNNAQKIASERKEGWTKQLRLTSLPSNGYVIGKVISATALTIPAIAVVFAAGAATGVHLSAAHWATAFLAIWVSSLSFTALGIAIGYGVPHDSVQLVALIAYIGFSFLGGLWFNLGTGVMRKIGEVTPTYQVRHITTDILTGSHIQATNVVVLLAWVVGAIAVATAVYRRGGESS